MITPTRLFALFLLLPSLAIPAYASHERRGSYFQPYQRLALDHNGDVPLVDEKWSQLINSRPLTRRTVKKCRSEGAGPTATGLPTATTSPGAGGISVGISIGTPSGSHPSLTPNGIKAGLSAGDAFDYVKDHIGWWYGGCPVL